MQYNCSSHLHFLAIDVLAQPKVSMGIESLRQVTLPPGGGELNKRFRSANQQGWNTAACQRNIQVAPYCRLGPQHTEHIVACATAASNILPLTQGKLGD